MLRAMAYFERTGATSFRATQYVGGAWRADEQHIAPALGLLLHAVETDRDARRDDRLVVARVSYDILGVLPIADVETAVRVVRGGRTIELVEATLSHAGRPAVLLRAWLMQQRDTAALAGTALTPLPPPEDLPSLDWSSLWSGGFIDTVEVRRVEASPGRALSWVRTALPLVADEPVSRLAAVAGLADVANGMSPRADPAQVAFPNVDLTAHLFAEPHDGWLGLDTTASFGATGLGLTSTVLHDERGPFGVMAQMLTVRPVAPRP